MVFGKLFLEDILSPIFSVCDCGQGGGINTDNLHESPVPQNLPCTKPSKSSCPREPGKWKFKMSSTVNPKTHKHSNLVRGDFFFK